MQKRDRGNLINSDIINNIWCVTATVNVAVMFANKECTV